MLKEGWILSIPDFEASIGYRVYPSQILVSTKFSGLTHGIYDITGKDFAVSSAGATLVMDREVPRPLLWEHFLDVLEYRDVIGIFSDVGKYFEASFLNLLSSPRAFFIIWFDSFSYTDWFESNWRGMAVRRTAWDTSAFPTWWGWAPAYPPKEAIRLDLRYCEFLDIMV